MNRSQYLQQWEHPSDYGGFSPDGDYVIAGQSRDSDALERSNYQRIFEDLQNKSIELNCVYGIDGTGEESDMVYDFRAGHWAVGWVETILICQDAPQALIDYADAIAAALADYPVYDESHWCELEFTEASNYWESLSVSERVGIIQDNASDCSIIAARYDYTPDDCGIYEYLRTP